MNRSAVLATVIWGVASALAQTPNVASIDPPSTPAGSPAVTMTLSGTNFQPASIVTWNGSPLATAAVSTVRLTATIPASLLTVPALAAIRVVNAGGLQSNTLLFQVAAPDIVIGNVSVPAASAGTPYAVTFTATGGTPPYRWSASGSLPPGLSVSPSGLFSGTPTTAGVYQFAAEVSDITGQTASKPFSVTVSQPQISITTASTLPQGLEGQVYNHALAATGGTRPYQWTAGPGFPPGLTINAATGVISGTLATAGTFTFPVRVADANEASDTRSFTLLVRPPPLSITTIPPLFRGMVGVAYAQSFTASGGAPPYRWTIGSGQTGGLTLDSATGTLQGTPQTAGTYSFTIQVGDSTGLTASRGFSLEVNPPSLTITTGSALPSAAVGAVYRQSIAVVGGTAPYIWSLVSGHVPGLTIDSSGVLSGTPTEPGAYTLSLRAQDAAGVSATRNFTLTITAGVLTITTGTDLPNAELNEAYLQTISAAGGASPYVWSVNGLPSGLGIDAATGVISGVPEAAGTYAFTARVTDAARATAVELFRLTVYLPPGPPVTISGLPAAAGAAEQLSFQIVLGSAYPAPVSGQAMLSFAPETGGGDSTIQFASGGRTANFTVPAGSVDPVLTAPIAFQTGTVAGTITVSVRLEAGGVTITSASAPSATVRVERSAPVLTSARVVRSDGGLAVEITGFSTAREVTQASFTFAAGNGASLQNSTVTIPVEQLFRGWFQDPSSGQFGSQFVFGQSFTIQGDTSLVMPQSVTLTNRIGSATVTVER